MEADAQPSMTMQNAQRSVAMDASNHRTCGKRRVWHQSYKRNPGHQL